MGNAYKTVVGKPQKEKLGGLDACRRENALK
jgi:hypothetical protein